MSIAKKPSLGRIRAAQLLFQHVEAMELHYASKLLNTGAMIRLDLFDYEVLH
ncbi:hypothetical protein RI844_19040 [Thalassotalea fonticola]|uniref:Uncharacterized protein n=1 Tax=Thalassotalea fonticola TaxID=3065649 RepID=A0ABZ0GP03_9GAMM|nr:hypothetical protein RI844_19040 [Colwelliaceae bacterium S1-1]